MRSRLGDDRESGQLLLGGLGSVDATVAGTRVLTGGSGTPARKRGRRQAQGRALYGQTGGGGSGSSTARRQIP